MSQRPPYIEGDRVRVTMYGGLVFHRTRVSGLYDVWAWVFGSRVHLGTVQRSNTRCKAGMRWPEWHADDTEGECVGDFDRRSDAAVALRRRSPE